MTKANDYHPRTIKTGKAVWFAVIMTKNKLYRKIHLHYLQKVNEHLTDNNYLTELHLLCGWGWVCFQSKEP